MEELIAIITSALTIFGALWYRLGKLTSEVRACQDRITKLINEWLKPMKDEISGHNHRLDNLQQQLEKKILKGGKDND